MYHEEDKGFGMWASTTAFHQPSFCGPFHLIPCHPKVLMPQLYSPPPWLLQCACHPCPQRVPLKRQVGGVGGSFPQSGTDPSPFLTLYGNISCYHMENKIAQP